MKYRDLPYVDPMRLIQRVERGGTQDSLHLECGHVLIKPRVHLWPRRTRCWECRVWTPQA